MEVLIDGIKYVPEQPMPNRVSFWYMHDNHTFTRLIGGSLAEILKHADEVESGPRGSYGMLCPAKLLHDDKDLRCVGMPVHAKSRKDSKDHWEAGKKEWLASMIADPDVMRLIRE